jgi:succinoglycan biosynthesis transport protein ExoP
LGSGLMKNLLTRWKEEFDHIVLDSPPAISVTDAVLLSAEVDRVILVIRSGQTTKAALLRVYELLLHVNANVMGVVVNAFNVKSPDHYYYNYSSAESGSYFNDESERTESKSAKSGVS